MLLEILKYIATSSPVAAFWGGVAGGAFGAIVLGATWRWDSQRRELREIVQAGLRVHESREAWILENAGTHKLSEIRNGSWRTEPHDTEPWLRQVEIRLVLDQAPWNAPDQPFFGIIDGRRTWIIRDHVIEADSYDRTADVASLRSYPALLSSKAMHELSANIEFLSSLFVWRIWPLRSRDAPILRWASPHILWAIRPFAASLCGEDRSSRLESRLSETSRTFLRWYRANYQAPPAPMPRKEPKT